MGHQPRDFRPVLGHVTHGGIAVVTRERLAHEGKAVVISDLGRKQHKVLRMNHDSHPLVLIEQSRRVIDGILQCLHRFVGPSHLADNERPGDSGCVQDIVHLPVTDGDKQFPYFGVLDMDILFPFH